MYFQSNLIKDPNSVGRKQSPPTPTHTLLHTNTHTSDLVCTCIFPQSRRRRNRTQKWKGKKFWAHCDSRNRPSRPCWTCRSVPRRRVFECVVKQMAGNEREKRWIFLFICLFTKFWRFCMKDFILSSLQFGVLGSLTSLSNSLSHTRTHGSGLE